MNKSVLVVLALVLAACSPDEQAAQRDQASKVFAQAQKHVSNATCGYNNSAEAGRKFDGTLDAYIAAELNQAVDALKSATSLGSPSQQVSAALLLAEAHTARAHTAAAQAAGQWFNQSNVANSMLKTLAAARTSQIVADAQGAADTTGLVNDLTMQRQGMGELVSQHQSTIAGLKQQIDALTTQRDELAKQIASNNAQAQQFHQRAEGAEGQLRFDTIVQAAEASRKAAQASAQADDLTARLDMLQSEMVVAQANMTMASERAAQLDQAIGQVRNRDTELSKTVAAARRNADAGAAELGASLEKLAEEHIQNVIQPLDAARSDLNAAIDVLEAAKGKDRDQTDSVALALATRRYELAQLTVRYAAILAGYRDLVAVLAEQSAVGFPAQTVGLIGQTAGLATERATRLATEAATALGVAQTALQDLANDAANDAVKATANVMLQSVKRQLSASPASPAPADTVG